MLNANQREHGVQASQDELAEPYKYNNQGSPASTSFSPHLTFQQL
jgi:hypothetical protein